MLRWHVDFVAVLIITFALLVFSHLSSVRVPDPAALAVFFN
jgi:hypothetical protein